MDRRSVVESGDFGEQPATDSQVRELDASRVRRKTDALAGNHLTRIRNPNDCIDVFDFDLGTTNDLGKQSSLQDSSFFTVRRPRTNRGFVTRFDDTTHLHTSVIAGVRAIVKRVLVRISAYGASYTVGKALQPILDDGS